MAIEDAAVLARRLLGGGEPAPNLAAFAEDRYPRTSAITRASWRFGRLGQWAGRQPCWLRDRLIGVVLLAVGPSGLLSYATFDVGPLPATVPAGASSRDDRSPTVARLRRRSQ